MRGFWSETRVDRDPGRYRKTGDANKLQHYPIAAPKAVYIPILGLAIQFDALLGRGKFQAVGFLPQP
jgi:hypothetical protein